MRAREPDRAGWVERDGVRVAWELFDRDLPLDAPTVFLLPTWAIVHSRFWKGQVPFLARFFRVLTLDNRGNGRSDRPSDPAQVTVAETVADCVAAMDATDTRQAVIVGLSMGGAYALRLAALYPERVAGAIFVAPAVAGFGDPSEDEEGIDFDMPAPVDDGWQRRTRISWKRDWEGFAEFFFREIFTEPHSTKAIEDGVRWALETTPEALIAIEDAGALPEAAIRPSVELAPLIRCPALVVQGSADHLVDPSIGVAFATAIGAPLVWMEGAGHNPLARHPVRMNLLIRDFVRRVSASGRQEQKRRTTS